jgi:hypothetical protein
MAASTGGNNLNWLTPIFGIDQEFALEINKTNPVIFNRCDKIIKSCLNNLPQGWVTKEEGERKCWTIGYTLACFL